MKRKHRKRKKLNKLENTLIILTVIALVVFVAGFVFKDKLPQKPAVSYTPLNDKPIEQPVTETEKKEEPTVVIEPVFTSSGIDESTLAIISGKSLKEDHIVAVEDLRLLNVAYYGFDDMMHQGSIICNKVVADDLLEIFKELYEAKFPIEKVKLVDEYDADDLKSIADNNSSCYNHRTIYGSAVLSVHAKGVAIDINPLQNPSIVNGTVLPEEVSRYQDRTLDEKGMITRDSAAYRIFRAHGWNWGGDWSSLKDYQHFEKKWD